MTNSNRSTPEEAYKKICPARSSCGVDKMCVGPDCMAWRWEQAIQAHCPEGWVQTEETPYKGVCSYEVRD